MLRQALTSAAVAVLIVGAATAQTGTCKPYFGDGARNWTWNASRIPRCLVVNWSVRLGCYSGATYTNGCNHTQTIQADYWSGSAWVPAKTADGSDATALNSLKMRCATVAITTLYKDFGQLGPPPPNVAKPMLRISWTIGPPGAVLVPYTTLIPLLVN